MAENGFNPSPCLFRESKTDGRPTEKDSPRLLEKEEMIPRRRFRPCKLIIMDWIHSFYRKPVKIFFLLTLPFGFKKFEKLYFQILEFCLLSILSNTLRKSNRFLIFFREIVIISEVEQNSHFDAFYCINLTF